MGDETVEVHGLKASYKIFGSSDADRRVLLLHGWGAKKELFDRVGAFLASEGQAQVIALDFPGFGSSDIPSSVWKVDDFVSFTVSFLDKLSIPAVDLVVGHSHGGRVALKAATQHPERFKKLLLVGSAGLKSKSTFWKTVKVKTFKFLRKTIELVVPKGATREKLLDELRGYFGSTDYRNAGVMRDTLVAVLQEDLSDILPSVSQPTLLIWGENDTDSPLEVGKKMESLIPNAGLVVWENAGHYAFLDRPDQFNVVARHFLTDGNND